MNYSDYIKCHNKYNLDLCGHCRNISAKMTWKEKYGFSHPIQVQEIKNKGVLTCIQKYGCENPMQNQEIKKKAENTLFRKYGVRHPLQNEEIHKKVNDACIEQYGVACVFKSDVIKDKIKETNLSKYGVENPMQNQYVKAKAMKTLCDNGRCPTSSQQIKIYNMIKELYGNCELNYPLDELSLDCMVDVNNILIDVEYDGIYWHQDLNKDLRRNKVVINLGYKVLRIRSKSSVPTKEQLKEAIDYLAYTNHHYKLIELDI